MQSLAECVARVAGDGATFGPIAYVGRRYAQRSAALPRHRLAPGADAAAQAARMAIIEADASKRAYAPLMPHLDVAIHVFDAARQPEWPEPMEQEVMLSGKMWRLVGNNARTAIEAGGWFDSVGGRPFTLEEMDDFGENALRKLAPFLGSSTRVLELACGSGMTMRKLAPHVQWIEGIDISPSITQHAETALAATGLRNWRIRHGDLCSRQLSLGTSYDVVVVNSFAQLLSSLEQLRGFVRWVRSLLAPSGILFLGDLMDEARYRDLAQWIADKASGCVARDDGRYLYVPRQFFVRLAELLGIECVVTITSKESRHQNEMTLFRYDAVIRFGVRGTITNFVDVGSQDAFICQV